MPFTRAVLGVLLCSLRGASACGPGQYYYQDCRISTFCEIFGCWSMDCDDKCGTCPAGQFSPGGPACTQCAAGHYSQSGWGSCEQCPAGQTSNSGDTPCENRISRPLDRRRLGLLVDASETVSPTPSSTQVTRAVNLAGRGIFRARELRAGHVPLVQRQTPSTRCA